MREQKKRGSKLINTLILAILTGFLCVAGMSMEASAEGDFKLDAEKLSSNDRTDDILVTVENRSADWEGTVRVSVGGRYHTSTVYDTLISLPAGTKKQMTVKIPVGSSGDSYGNVEVKLLDKKGKEVTSREYTNLLLEDGDSLGLGILSDSYSSLTYLDMGGETLYYYDHPRMIRLAEITLENLQDSLDTLEFLVIDDYHTELLTQNDLDAIEKWNYNGGVLIIGTGLSGEDTLKGFENSHVPVKYTNGTWVQQDPYATDTNYSDLHMVALRDFSGNYFEEYFSKAMINHYGDGAVAVLPYSLVELGTRSAFFADSTYTRETYVNNMLDNISQYSGKRYYNRGGNSTYENYNSVQRMLHIIGNGNTPLNMTVLKILIVLYVVVAGPVLYIVLRLLKKRDLYWVAVPVAAVLGIILVYLAGQGFEVKNARMYTVDAVNLSDNGSNLTYMYGYNAGYKEWDLKLDDSYEYAGALYNTGYIYDDEDDYYYRISREGNGFHVGIRPTGSFEDCYFQAGRAGNSAYGDKNIVLNNITMNGGWPVGRVTNATGEDFPYFAVVVENNLYVYKSLPAGETVDLQELFPLGMINQSSYNMRSEYVNEVLYDKYTKKKYEDSSYLAALGAGLCVAYPTTDISRVAVIGVADRAGMTDRSIDDDCTELAYRCYYVVK